MRATIRRLTERDRDEWLALRIQLWPECAGERHDLEMRQLTGGSARTMIAVAELHGRLIGFAEVSTRADHVEGTKSSPVAYLEGWYVSPDTRGQGVGRALVRFAEEWAKAEGLCELASDTEPDNHGSQRAHAALGFSEVGRSIHFVKPLVTSGEMPKPPTLTIGLVPSEQAPQELLALGDSSPRHIARYLPGSTVLVGELAGAVVSVAVLQCRPDEVELMNLAVAEKWQRFGLGRQMLGRVVELAKTYGVRRIILGTGNSGLGQLAFYQKNGFRIAGVVPGFFADYDPPVIENGIRCLDMVRLVREVEPANNT